MVPELRVRTIPVMTNLVDIFDVRKVVVVACAHCFHSRVGNAAVSRSLAKVPDHPVDAAVLELAW